MNQWRIFANKSGLQTTLDDFRLLAEMLNSQIETMVVGEVRKIGIEYTILKSGMIVLFAMANDFLAASIEI